MAKQYTPDTPTGREEEDERTAQRRARNAYLAETNALSGDERAQREQGFYDGWDARGVYERQRTKGDGR